MDQAYEIGELVKMLDTHDKCVYYGVVSNISASSDSARVKYGDLIYEVLWFDQETSEYQPFTWHYESEIDPVDCEYTINGRRL